MIIEAFAALLVVVSILLPGLLMSFTLLSKTSASDFDKLMIGVILGMFVPPAMMLLENIALGLNTSLAMVFANIAVICLACAGAYYYQNRKLELRMPKLVWKDEYLSESHIMKFLSSNKTMILLVLVMGFGFLGRYLPAADPFFSEIDPYYYTHLTQLIVQQGHAPLFNDDAYSPQMKFQHSPALLNYMVAGWYFVYQGVTGASYSNALLIAISQFYPPLVGALLSYLGFLVVSQEADRRIALVTAGLFAFTPQLIQKMAAGVTEAQPFALFASIMILTFYILAIKQKSLRWGILASVSTLLIMIGSFQSIWPMMVLSTYILLSSLLEFYSVKIDERWLIISAGVVLAAVVGDVANSIYMADANLDLSNGVYLLIGSLVPAAMLYAISHYVLAPRKTPESQRQNEKLMVLGGLLVVGLLSLAVTPLGSKVSSYISYGLSFSKPTSAIMMTVAEEAPANEGFDLSSYGFFHGYFSPHNLLMLSGVLCFAIMLMHLWKHRRKDLIWLSLALFVVIFVFNNQFDSVVNSAADGIGLGDIAKYIASNDIFYYMVMAIGSLSVTYIFSEEKNKLPLLFVLIFFPISFIGLNKLKYIAHLSTALPIMVAFILFSMVDLSVIAVDIWSSAKNEKAKRYARGGVLCVGFVLVLLQFVHAAGSPVRVGCDSSDWGKSLNSFTASLALPLYPATSGAVGQLCYARMDTDWIDAMDWLRLNLNSTDRVESWWDYGHWTTFIAGKKTVIDPGNAYMEYNQETARAFVNGPGSELIRVMHYHGATYLMLDAELIQKWGALNFLGGTFPGLAREPNPKNDFNVTPAIDWTLGPGRSDWEMEHSFEMIYSVYYMDQTTGQPTKATCPGIIPRQMLYSGLTGGLYCISQGQAGVNLYAMLNSATEPVLLSNPQLVQMGTDQYLSLSPISPNSQLYINTNAGSSPLLLNLNPDLGTFTNGTKTSKLFNSPYVQLFFFEKLDGFELVHKTPSNRVKIFKLTG